ncbi:MAG: hypothetical protein LM577_00825 [Thermoproteaceae archaeon]|nr:hypothetical protein [Thermoproteaceae archaeon]
MEGRRDCLIAVLSSCEGWRERQQETFSRVLARARTRARKLIIVDSCSNVIDAINIVRLVARDNVDMSMRHYRGADLLQVRELEGCGTVEVINFWELAEQ